MGSRACENVAHRQKRDSACTELCQRSTTALGDFEKFVHRAHCSIHCADCTKKIYVTISLRNEDRPRQTETRFFIAPDVCTVQTSRAPCTPSLTDNLCAPFECGCAHSPATRCLHDPPKSRGFKLANGTGE